MIYGDSTVTSWDLIGFHGFYPLVISNNYGLNDHAITGKTYYFDWAIFHGDVKLRAGTVYPKTKWVSYILVILIIR